MIDFVIQNQTNICYTDNHISITKQCNRSVTLNDIKQFIETSCHKVVFKGELSFCNDLVTKHEIKNKLLS